MDILFKIAICACLYNFNLDSNTPNKTQPIQEYKYSEFKFNATDSTESFKDFCIFFFSNYKNQFSRVKFPLKYITSVGTGNPRNGTSYFPSTKWTFFDLKKAKWISKLISKTKNSRTVNFQVDETGIYYNCKFKLIEGKWYLVEVFDGSM